MDIVEEFTRLVAASKDVPTERAKKAFVLLFREALKHDRDTVLEFSDDQADFAQEVSDAAHAMLSANCTTHLNDFFKRHNFQGDVGGSGDTILGNTAWVFPKDWVPLGYGPKVEAAHPIAVNMEEIDAVELT